MIENSIVQTPVKSFDVGKIKPAFMQTKLRYRATNPYYISYSLSFVLSYCDLAGTFNVLTYTAATYHVADISSTSKSYDTGLPSTLNLPMALMGHHTRLFVSTETYEVYINFTLFIHVILL